MVLTLSVFQCPAIVCKSVLLDFSPLEVMYRSSGINLRQKRHISKNPRTGRPRSSPRARGRLPRTRVVRP